MDSRFFDALTRAFGLAGSRRRTLAMLVGGALGLRLPGALDFPPDVAAKKNKKKKRKKRKKIKGPCAPGKSKKNSCRKNKQCCTGVCRKKRCRCNVCASGCPFTSVQAAIDAANPGATIRLCAGTFTGILTIDKDLTLRGAGDGTNGSILDGDQADSVVTVAAGVSVALVSLRITGGDGAPDGGGIHNTGTLAVSSCMVTDNEGFLGGGIFNDGDLTLTTSSVTGNTAVFQGGGILSNTGAAVSLTNSSVTLNTAGTDGGGIGNGNTLILTNSSVTDNTATTGEGGGIYNVGDITLNGTNTIADNDPNDCFDSGAGTGCP